MSGKDESIYKDSIISEAALAELAGLGKLFASDFVG
jgi:hypothetical protein